MANTFRIHLGDVMGLLDQLKGEVSKIVEKKVGEYFPKLEKKLDEVTGELKSQTEVLKDILTELRKGN